MKFLAAFDGSRGALRALEFCIGRLLHPGDTCNVLIVTERLRLKGLESTVKHDYEQQVNKFRHEQMQEIYDNCVRNVARLCKASSPGSKCGKAVSVSIKEGDDAREVIVDEAEKQSTDVIVVGRRGVTEFDKMHMGSVSEWLVKNAQAAVLVVH